MESLTSGTLAGTGSFRCEECGYVVTLAATDAAARLPGLRGRELRPRLAVRRRALRRAAADGPGGRPRRPSSRPRRAELERQPGQYLVYDDGDAVRVVALEREWTRDRPQPGRRRALRRPDGVAPPRADRAPGRRRAGAGRPQPQRRVRQRRARRVARRCADGDEIVVGRYRLHFVDGAGDSPDAAPPTPGGSPTARPSAGEPERALAVRASGEPARESRPRLSVRADGRRRSRCSPRRAAPARRPRCARSPTCSGGPGCSVLAVDLDPQGNLSDYFDVDPDAEPTIGDVLAGPRQAPREAIHDDVIPANLVARRGRAGARRQDGPRADAAQGAASERRRRLRRHPHRLPAVARPADRQRARRRRPRAAQRRGAVLRAAGRRAGARGHRAGPRQPEPRPRVARRACFNIADMRTRPLARGVRRRCSEHVGDKLFDTTVRAVDRLRRVGRARASRSSTTGPTSAPDYLALADELLGALGLPRRAGASCARALSRRLAPSRRAPDGLELAHVGALRLERRAQDVGPARRLARAAPRRRRRSARSGTRRARSGRRRRSSRRARRARARARRAPSSAGRGARGGAGAGGRARPAGDEVPVAAREPERQQRRVGDVEDRVGHRHLVGQRRARLPACGPARAGTTSTASRPGRRRRSASPAPSAQIDEPAVQRGRDVVGMALELGGERQQVGVELEQVVGGHQPGDERRGARSRARRRAGSPSGSGT